MERNTNPDDRVTTRPSLDDLVGRVDRPTGRGDRARRRQPDGDVPTGSSIDSLPRGGPAEDRVPWLARLDPARVGAGLIVVAVVIGGGWWLTGRGSGAATIELPMTSVVDAATTTAPGNGTPAAAGPDATGPDATGPDATGLQAAPAFLVVHVAGSVVTPGLVELAADARVADAINAAGGLAPTADSDRLNLAEPLVDGQRIFVPAVGQEPPPAVPLSGGTTSSGGRPGGAGPVPRVSLNSATAEELDALPGVGPSTAAAIVAYRDQNGPFTSVDDLLDVRGIGPAKLEGLVDLVQVG